jgi:hypothetical protein
MDRSEIDLAKGKIAEFEGKLAQAKANGMPIEYLTSLNSSLYALQNDLTDLRTQSSAGKALYFCLFNISRYYDFLFYFLDVPTMTLSNS